MSTNNDTYREAFLTHLRKAWVGDEQTCESYADWAENELSTFIKQEVKSDFEGVYVLRDLAFYRQLRSQLQLPTHYSQLDEAHRERHSQTLRHYCQFLESNYNPDQPTLKVTKPKKKRTAQPKEEDEPFTLVEGDERIQVMTRYERNPRLRKACLAHHGYRCAVCGIDFEHVYGELGREYIEVHHRRPISTYRERHEVDPVNDLVPLCANCHAMIHRGRERVLTVDELKACYHGPQYETNHEND